MIADAAPGWDVRVPGRRVLALEIRDVAGLGMSRLDPRVGVGAGESEPDVDAAARRCEASGTTRKREKIVESGRLASARRGKG